jgi:D-alanyl-D-alanine carboxypeptidase
MDQFQRTLDQWRAHANVPVAVGAVRRDGSLVWHGASIADGGDVASPASQFPIYSITKTLTAVCLLRLDQSGVMRVNDPIAKWIDLPVPQAVTLTQLLRHTSGVPDYGPLREYHDAVRTTPSAPWTDDEFISATLRKELLFAPGAGWAYSNVGYLLLRRAIEHATGRSYRQCVADQIAWPLGLAHTFVAETIDDWRCCVPGYGDEVGATGKVVDIRSSYHPGWCAPGVAVSTVDDVTLFYDALFSGGLVDQQHLEQMLQLTRVPGSHPPAVTPSYGMGIMADPDGPLGPSYGHGGGGPGYSLYAAILPHSPQGRLSVAVFYNTSLGAEAGQGVDELFQAAARVPGSWME